MIKNLNALLSHGNEKLRRVPLQIADTLLEKINAYNIVKSSVSFRNSHLYVGNEILELDDSRVFIVSIGKASLPMAKAMREILGPRIYGGIINTPFPGTVEGFTINVLPHPLPDERTLKASLEIIRAVERLRHEDILIMLISGGASALFEVPERGFSIQMERELVEMMMKGGASIHELNRVRIAISAVKGGKFLRHVRGRCISLIISDVIGPPQLVGSGPTYPQSYNIDELIEKYHLPIKDISRQEIVDKTCKNIVLADNTYALERGREIAEKMGLRARIFPAFLTGEPRTVYRKILDSMDDEHNLFIFGGETWVNVGSASGTGGRNQELALYLAREIEEGSCFLCIGTDGIDGPTDAAGGIVDDTTLRRILHHKIDLEKELWNHNSYHVLKKIGDVIYTGYTGTNLADVCIGFRAKSP